MGRSSLIALIAALAVVGAYAACSSDSGGGVNSGRPDGGPQCKIGNVPGFTCTAGTACVNSVCVPTCTGDAGDCPAGQYCEACATPGGCASGALPPRNVCAWNTPISCTKNTDCPFPQNCVGAGPSIYGLCQSGEFLGDGRQNLDCTLDPDNCAPDAICQIQQGANGTFKQCVGLPACGQDGSCPTGIYGSVCNDKNPIDGGQIISGKQRICLYSLCVTNSDCPTNSVATTHCFRTDKNVPYGGCKFGQVGDPCFSDADCPQAARCAGAAGSFEDGGTPGTCGPCADGGTTGPCL